MDTDSLKRAWEYGLRLLVVHAVNSEFLCEVADLKSGTCADRDAIEAQLEAAKELERTIDAAEGGAGRGWYRIALTPQDARDVIAAGKLAVVLGVETANAYGSCNLVERGVTDGVPELVFAGPPESTYELACSTDLIGGFFGSPTPLVAGGASARAIALMERYRELGARHFYLIHNMEGAAGGNSLSIPLLHASVNPSDRTPGLFPVQDRVSYIDRVIADIRPPFNSWDCSSTYDFDGGRCNTAGLTELGTKLARAIASYGMLIDVDHLSLKAKANLRYGERGLGEYYPMISSHAGFNELNHGAKSNEDQLTGDATADLIKWGGAIGPILLQGTTTTQPDTYPPDTTIGVHRCGGTTEGWLQAYRYAVSKLTTTKLYTGEAAFVGVGFGSDFNGLAGWPRPRFKSAACEPMAGSIFDWSRAFVGPQKTPIGGCCYAESEMVGRVQYPFKSPLTGIDFDKSVLPWSGRSVPFDISFDGVAHVGMIPDFVEELRVLGLSDSELAPLWHGAEAYIRAWEAAASWSSVYTKEVTEGKREDCQRLRAELLTWDFGPPDETLGGERLPDAWATVARWNSSLDKLRMLSCDGTE